ncbi:MAG: beta-ketoacyl-ACP synthase II [Myxococcota bacterium]|nr:beta-ketoacyl-ACP synthase II [Myxococcota bacterium]
MRRVVITGIGIVSPCGLDAATTWENLVEGRCAVDRITLFDTSDWSVQIAAEVRNWDPSQYLSRQQIKRLDRFAQFAMVAAEEVVRDAGLDATTPLGDRAGVYVGSGIGGCAEFDKGSVDLHSGGPKAISPFFIPKVLTNLAAGHVAMKYGARGPSLCISTACASGNHSIGEAWRVIRTGDADLVIAGGAEAGISRLGMAGFMSMKALSKRNDDPGTASRPFDVDRNGFVMGEGAGMVMIEALEHAQARGARIYAELIGYGLSNDAYHITAPPPDGDGAVRCMNMALRSARVEPEEVDYINAHGTSTPANDRIETLAIKRVFGDHAKKLMVSSTKSMTGHLLGAAGGLETAVSAKALHHGLIPPTATLQQADPECDLDYVPGSSREQSISTAISNSFGFGGTNATLVLRRYSG